MAELAGGGAGGASPVPREEEHSWPQLPGSWPSPGPCSSSSSICTEDFAASFWEAMVEPLLCQQEPAGDVPREGAHPRQDEPLFPTGRSLAPRAQPAMELGRAPWQDRSPSRSRRESLESLGARISPLSQSRVGVAWGLPWASPSARPAPGHRDSPRGHLGALALPGHSWRTPGISAGRSSAGARTGSPGSSFPRASSARTRGHPALGMRRQEPPALRRHGRNVTFAVDAKDREGADSSRSAGTAVAAPGHWGPPVSPGLRGDQKGGLSCKSWQGQGACVGQELLHMEKRKTPQEEKQELLERLRELQRGSRSLLQQRLRVLQRLHGLLQRDKAETLRQLREALEQDRAGTSILREHLPSRPRDPALPGRAGGSPAVGTPPPGPWGQGPRPGSAVGPGPSPAALGWAAGAARGHGGVPPSLHGPSSSSLPSPSRALHVLRGLRQQIQRRLGQWQRVQGALAAAGHCQEEGEQPGKAPGAPGSPGPGECPRPCPEAGLGFRGAGMRGQNPPGASKPGLSRPLPVLCRHRGNIPVPPPAPALSPIPGLLRQLQHRFQELRLERTRNPGIALEQTGNPGIAAGADREPRDRGWSRQGTPGSRLSWGAAGAEGGPGLGLPQPRRWSQRRERAELQHGEQFLQEQPCPGAVTSGGSHINPRHR